MYSYACCPGLLKETTSINFFHHKCNQILSHEKGLPWWTAPLSVALFILLTKVKCLHNVSVSLNVSRLQIVQKTASLTNQLKK